MTCLVVDHRDGKGTPEERMVTLGGKTATLEQILGHLGQTLPKGHSASDSAGNELKLDTVVRDKEQIELTPEAIYG